VTYNLAATLTFGIPIALLVICLLALDQINPLAYFRAYRKRRGGNWHKVHSFLPGVPFVWIRVTWQTERPPAEIWLDTEPTTIMGEYR